MHDPGHRYSPDRRLTMPELTPEAIRELAGVPEVITRKQVIEAAKALGLDAAKIISLHASADRISVTCMPQPGWRMEFNFTIDRPISGFDNIEISGGY